MALVGVELEMLVNEQDAQTTRPPPCAGGSFFSLFRAAPALVAPSFEQ